MHPTPSDDADNMTARVVHRRARVTAHYTDGHRYPLALYIENKAAFLRPERYVTIAADVTSVFIDTWWCHLNVRVNKKRSSIPPEPGDVYSFDTTNFLRYYFDAATVPGVREHFTGRPVATKRHVRGGNSVNWSDGYTSTEIEAFFAEDLYTDHCVIFPVRLIADVFRMELAGAAE